MFEQNKIKINKRQLWSVRLKLLYISLICVLTICINGCNSTDSNLLYKIYEKQQIYDSSKEYITVTGEYNSSICKEIIFIEEKSSRKFYAKLLKDNKFEIKLIPSFYNVYAKIAGMSELQLVQKSVQVFENLTINLLNVKLVPIPIIKNVEVINVAKNTVTIKCETSIESEVRIEYATLPSFINCTHTDSKLSTKHVIQITDLIPATTYYFRVVASRFGIPETETYSQTYSFTTEAN